MREGRQRAYAQGHRGETWAAWFLRLHGWSILARRIRTARGEVDVVARRGRMVAFVEVKWRRSAADLATAIDDRRLARVAACAQAIAHRYTRAGDDMRIDVLLVAPRRWPRHIRNAWMPDGRHL